jgi:hypothetical protein
MELTTMGSLAGYKDRIDINYDNLNRVVSIKGYNIQLPPGSSPYDSIINYFFEYSGNSKMPHKATILKYLSPFSEIHYLQYNVSEQPVKDSALYYSNVNGWYFHHTTTLIRSANDIICRDSTITPGPPGAPPPPPQIQYNYLKYINNNFTEYNTGYPGSFFLDFDTGENPLNELNVAPLFILLDDFHLPFNQYWTIFSFSNNNNITRLKFEFNPATNTARDTALLFNSYNSNSQLEKRYRCRIFHGGPTGFALDTVDMLQFNYQ